MDIIEIAIDEIKTFDRPSSHTSRGLIDEIKRLRSQLNEAHAEIKVLKKSKRKVASL